MAKKTNITDDMIEFGGTFFYLNLDALDLATKSATSDQEVTDKEIKIFKDELGNIISTEEITKTYNRGKEINVAKYDVFRLALEIIFEETDSSDETLGSNRALKSTSLQYKIAMNTLIKEGILVIIEE